MKSPFKSRKEEIQWVKENLDRAKKLNCFNVVQALESALNKLLHDNNCS